MCYCRYAYYRCIDTVDVHKVLLWVILYTHLSIRSPYTAELTGLFSVSCMQASTLLQVTSGSPSLPGGERHVLSEGKLGLLSSCDSDILYPYHAVQLSLLVSFLKNLNLLQADES